MVEGIVVAGATDVGRRGALAATAEEVVVTGLRVDVEADEEAVEVGVGVEDDEVVGISVVEGA